MEVTTNVKGQLAVTKTELRALELGFMSSRPIFDGRYDLIIDNKEKLLRIQIKYANGKSSNSSGNVVVKLDYENRVKKHFTYQMNEVDVLIVYIPEVDKLCYFPKDVFVGKRKLNIRLKPAKNNQTKGVIAAKDYYW